MPGPRFVTVDPGLDVDGVWGSATVIKVILYGLNDAQTDQTGTLCACIKHDVFCAISMLQHLFDFVGIEPMITTDTQGYSNHTGLLI